MRSVFIETLGCQKNEYDSQVLSAALSEQGFAVSDDPEQADVMIINTCGFIDDAKKESIEAIFELADIKGEDKLLVVTGCLSERYHDELVKEMPEVDMFFGVNDYVRIPGVLAEYFNMDEGAFIRPETSDLVGTEQDDLSYRKRDYSSYTHTGVLKIAEGCNNACSFCAIPSIRGKYRSKKIEDCIREAEDMADAGIRELVLIAQDTSQYGRDLYGKVRLPELLRELCRIEGIEWIRIMYLYDNGITDELIETMASEPKICKYVDMPIQHVSDNVLHAMKRQSTGASIRATISRLRERIPDICIRTTLLVGFPGETEEDMQELLEFIDSTKIDRLGAFAFSDEEGTTSYDLPGKLPEEVKLARRDAVMEHQMRVSEELNEKFIGSIQDVMVDEFLDGVYVGRTYRDATEIDCEVSFTSECEHDPGDIVRVRIINAYEYDIEGEEI